MVEIQDKVVTGAMSDLELEPEESQASCLQRHSQHLIRFLRQQKLHGCQRSDQIVRRVVDRTFELISSRPGRQLCSEAIVLTNNVFGLDAQFLPRILESRMALRNLRSHCTNFLANYGSETTSQEQAASGKLEFRLYSVVYLLAIFASHRPASDQERKAVSDFLNRSLLRKFLTINVEKHSKREIYFLFSVVLVFASRPAQGTKYLSLAKHFMLRHLAVVGCGDKTTFNYLHCLRIMLSAGIVTHNDIHKHAIVQFIVTNVGKHLNESHLIYALDSLRILLISHPIFGRECVAAGLVPLLVKEYHRHRLLASRLLDKLAPFLSKEDLLGVMSALHRRLRTEDGEHETLKTLSGLLQYLQPKDLLELLTEGLIQDLDECLHRNQSPLLLGLVAQALELVASVSFVKIPDLYAMVVSKMYSLRMMSSTAFSSEVLTMYLSRFQNVHPRR